MKLPWTSVPPGLAPLIALAVPVVSLKFGNCVASAIVPAIPNWTRSKSTPKLINRPGLFTRTPVDDHDIGVILRSLELVRSFRAGRSATNRQGVAFQLVNPRRVFGQVDPLWTFVGVGLDGCCGPWVQYPLVSLDGELVVFRFLIGLLGFFLPRNQY